MNYTIKQVSEITNLSARTLRYYEEIGLIQPQRDEQNDYRIYCDKDLDLLQQILIFRNMGMELSEIRRAIFDSSYDRQSALEKHLASLQNQKMQIEGLIKTVSNTICSMKGECNMSKKENFEQLKRQAIAENEQKYGDELRQKYGDDQIAAANEKMLGMNETKWDEKEQLEQEIFSLLKEAIAKSDYRCEAAQTACEKHKEWLQMQWKDGTYTKQAHAAMAEMYVADKRFTAYYDDKLGCGATEFFRNALLEYTK